MELALCLPLLMLATLAPAEICFRIHDRTTAEIAAYEGVRYAVRPGASAEEARAVAEEVLRGRGFDTEEVETTVLPRRFAELSPGDPVTVRVFIPAGRTGLPQNVVLPAGAVVAEATMLFEYQLQLESD